MRESLRAPSRGSDARASIRADATTFLSSRTFLSSATDLYRNCFTDAISSPPSLCLRCRDLPRYFTTLLTTRSLVQDGTRKTLPEEQGFRMGPCPDIYCCLFEGRR